MRRSVPWSVLSSRRLAINQSNPPGPRARHPDGTVVDITVSASSRLEFHDLRVHKEDAEYLIGRTARSSYLSIDEAGREALELLCAGSSLAEAKAVLSRRHAVGEVLLGGFVRSLLGAGFVRAVDGRPVASDAGQTSRSGRGDPLLSKERVSWLFSRPAALVAAGCTGLGAILLALNPASRPQLADLRIVESYPVAALLLLALTWALTLKHELAHLAAARWAGVDARISLGHRFFFPVLQTDMTSLWSVSRPHRYVAYLAGIFSDLGFAALAALALNADAFGLPVPVGPARNMLASVLLVELIVVLWQFNVFFRTDIYYLASDMLGYRDLHRQARIVVATWIGRTVGEWAARLAYPDPNPSRSLPPPRRERVIVACFAMLMVVGYGLYALLGAVYLGLLAAFLIGDSTSTLLLAGVPARGGAYERITAAVLLLFTLSLLIMAILRARRASARAVVYHVTGTEGL